MKKDTGGSAFPIVEQRNSIGDITAYFEGGMTLRDWFAGRPLETDITDNSGVCEALMGYPPPDWRTDRLGNAKYFMEAEARYRYMKADAMIETRKS